MAHPINNLNAAMIEDATETAFFPDWHDLCKTMREAAEDHFLGRP
jgi:hypothetical protein